MYKKKKQKCISLRLQVLWNGTALMAAMPIWPLIQSHKFVSVWKWQDIILNEASFFFFLNPPGLCISGILAQTNLEFWTLFPKSSKALVNM